MGVIEIDTVAATKEELVDEGSMDDGYKGVLVFVDSFNPTPQRREEWINHPDDPMGLETAGPTMVTVDHEPRDWGEHIYASTDGSFLDDNGYYDIDTEMLRLLDAKETLDLVVETIGLDRIDSYNPSI